MHLTFIFQNSSKRGMAYYSRSRPYRGRSPYSRGRRPHPYSSRGSARVYFSEEADEEPLDRSNPRQPCIRATVPVSEEEEEEDEPTFSDVDFLDDSPVTTHRSVYLSREKPKPRDSVFGNSDEPQPITIDDTVVGATVLMLGPDGVLRSAGVTKGQPATIVRPTTVKKTLVKPVLKRSGPVKRKLQTVQQSSDAVSPLLE